MARGLDIHPYYQRGIRWQDVNPKVFKYIWVKVSDGSAPYRKIVGGQTYYPSTLVNASKNRGISVGGYHYAQFGNPVQQANMFVTECERLGAVGVLPALDLEDPFGPNQQARDFGETFCEIIRERGYRPVVYMNDSMAGALKPDSWDSDPVLWIARYGAKPVKTRFDVHQYSSSDIVGGVTCDVNESYNDNHLNIQGEDDDMNLDDQLGYPDHMQPNPHPITIGDALRRIVANTDALPEIKAEAVALRAAVAAATNDPDITVDAMREIVTEAIKANVRITGTVEITGSVPETTQE